MTTDYFSYMEKQVAYSQHQFDRLQKRACFLLVLVCRGHELLLCFIIGAPKFS